MIELVDNIGVLIDESVEIPDIEKEDEFILHIDNPILNEGIEKQFAQIGIIYEVTGARTAAADTWHKQQKAEAQKKEDDASRGPNLDGSSAEDVEMLRRSKNMNDRADRLEARGNERNTASAQAGAKETDDKAFDDMLERSKNMNDRADRLEARGNERNTASAQAGAKEVDDKAFGDDNPGFMSAITAAVKENPLVALGGAVIAAAGGYLIYRYMNSIYRLNKATNYYKKLATSTSDPTKKSKYQQKANMYETRLEQAKAKARENKKDYISKTKEMQARYSEMKKSGGDSKELAKMEKKLAARNKVLSKIGAL